MIKEIDVIGIGNALVDLTYNVDDEFLKRFNIDKGNSNSIDSPGMEKMLNTLGAPQNISCGGSSANTIWGVNYLGGKTCFMGKVGIDFYGQKFIKELKEKNIIVSILQDQKRKTGNTITFITPDKERTFLADLGAAAYFRKNNLDEKAVINSKIFHPELYLLRFPDTRESFFHAIEIAKQNKTKVSLDLSSPKLVEKTFNLENLLGDYVDIVFANEEEARAFTNKEDEGALNELSNYCETAVVKLGERGSLIKHKKEIYKVNPFQVKLANTNGAGDMYAAGILYGITNGLSIERAGKLASKYSAKVVSIESARLS
ncbi:MAG: adenosine kinase [Candidatus Pacearchaeota archaeon]|jgi:sugar/nucleoside kinase (ribokinase family)